MRLAYFLAMLPSILLLPSPAAKLSGNFSATEIEDSTKTAPVGPGAMGARVVRAQILLDRARFSPGEIDGVYGDDLGITVKGFQENHGLKATGTIDAEMWRLLASDAG